MPRIDAHQHFWKYDEVRDSWISEGMSVIRKDFLPEHLQPILRENGFEGCILVQSAQPEPENGFLLEAAAAHDFIKGVVGWVDLLADDVEDRLATYQPFEKLKGFRYILQGEADRAFMLKPAFKNGLAKLSAFGYTYDLLILPDQLLYAKELVAAFPNQPFVIDHLAKPNLKAQELESWKQGIRALAAHENVSCKVSGMVTEADWKNWRKEDFMPAMDCVVEAFGTERLLFGSDWPVCLVAASYEETLDIVQDYFKAFSKEEQAAVFGNNAAKFYKVNN